MNLDIIFDALREHWWSLLITVVVLFACWMTFVGTTITTRKKFKIVRKEIKGYKASVENAENMLEKTSAELESLRTIHADFQTQYTNLQSQYAELENKLDILSQENASLATENSRLKTVAENITTAEKTITAEKIAKTKPAMPKAEPSLNDILDPTIFEDAEFEEEESDGTVTIYESAQKKTPSFIVAFDRPKNNWIIKKHGQDRATRRADTKEEAVKIAKSLAKKHNANLQVHKKDGKFQKV